MQSVHININASGELRFVIVDYYRFRSNTVEQATVPAVLPLPRYYRSRGITATSVTITMYYCSGWFQYCGKSTVTAVFLSSLLPCSSL